MQLPIGRLRACHLNGVDAKEESRHKRVYSVGHVMHIKVLASELMSARIVVPDLIADEDSKSHK